MTKLLIADDESNILTLTEMLFKDMGMTVITAKNGQEALDKIFSERPDIIITDIIMPKKNGFEICKEVRNNPETEHIPIILLSALGDEYNKLTGFEGGADDYVTKPFNIEELKARVKALLMRYNSRKKTGPSEEALIKPKLNQGNLVTTGIEALDVVLHGGIPKGSNILVTGSLGSGKSSLGRSFLKQGLLSNQSSLFIAIDDNPSRIRAELSKGLPVPINDYENNNHFRLIDAYSWTTLTTPQEIYAITGKLDLNQLAGVISDAGTDLGQTIQVKKGGRRVLDSISSLLINFDIASVQQFLNQIARTALSFGDVTTLFLLEEGTVDETVLNNIKYVMDGIIELKQIQNDRHARISSMKWATFDKEWVTL